MSNLLLKVILSSPAKKSAHGISFVLSSTHFQKNERKEYVQQLLGPIFCKNPNLIKDIYQLINWPLSEPKPSFEDVFMDKINQLIKEIELDIEKESDRIKQFDSKLSALEERQDNHDLALKHVSKVVERLVPHSNITNKIIQNFEKMNKEQLRSTFIDSGILTKDGKLAKEYCDED